MIKAEKPATSFFEGLGENNVFPSHEADVKSLLANFFIGSRTEGLEENVLKSAFSERSVRPQFRLSVNKSFGGSRVRSCFEAGCGPFQYLVITGQLGICANWDGGVAYPERQQHVRASRHDRCWAGHHEE